MLKSNRLILLTLALMGENPIPLLALRMGQLRVGRDRMNPIVNPDRGRARIYHRLVLTKMTSC